MKYAAMFIGLHTMMVVVSSFVIQDPDHSRAFREVVTPQEPGWLVARALFGEWGAAHIGIVIPIFNIVIYGFSFFVIRQLFLRNFEAKPDSQESGLGD